MSLILIDQKSERRTAPLAIVPPLTDRGLVLTAIQPGRAIVWLVGEIDRSVWPDLQEVLRTVRGRAPHVVVDPARMTSCDGSLGDFLRGLGAVAALTIRRPTPVLRQLLRSWGLMDILQVADFPGPAPVIPA
jgi:hypothetical protein